MHLIQKNSIILECRTEKFGKKAHAAISELVTLHFYPKVEALLDRYDQEKKLIEIDRIPIQIVISKDNWKEELINKSLYEIEKIIAGLVDEPEKSADVKVKKISKKTLSRKQVLQQQLVTYLSTGFLEQNGFVNTLKKLFDEVEVDSVLVENVLALMKSDLNIILRFVLNLPDQLQLKIRESALKNEVITKDNLLKKRIASTINGEVPPRLRKQFKSALIWILQGHKIGISDAKIYEISKIAYQYFEIPPERLENFAEAIAKILQQPGPKAAEHFENPLKSGEYSEIEKQNWQNGKHTIWHISNAGLILLHPFLVKLLADLGYTKKDRFIAKEKQHRAVLLIRYLADFNEQLFENELLLGKLLCGVPAEETVRTEWEITKEEKRACLNLLTAVIQHWGILKNTSITTLQTSFLQRPGKLEKRKDKSHELTLQQESIDMLLDHLPWGLGIVKTPFMEKYVDCLWN